MILPSFLIGDNTDYPNDTFIIHTQFPRFILDIKNDEIEWLEEFNNEDLKEIDEQTESLIEKAFQFYDREMEKYEKE